MSVPGGKPFQSKLIPFTSAIRTWRRQGKSYSVIASLLAERGVAAAPSSIFHFVKVRSRKRRVITMLGQGAEDFLSHQASSDSLAALKRQPVRARAKRSAFHFDETQPLTLQPKGKP